MTIAGSIAKDISTIYPLTQKLMQRWDSVKFVLKEKYIIGQRDITAVQAEKYRGDLFGLFKNELNINHEHCYPHMLVNGYYSPNDYDAKVLIFNILNVEMLKSYYSLFIKEEDISNLS